jgi:hypothetical protein
MSSLNRCYLILKASRTSLSSLSWTVLLNISMYSMDMLCLREIHNVVDVVTADSVAAVAVVCAAEAVIAVAAAAAVISLFFTVLFEHAIAAAYTAEG